MEAWGGWQQSVVHIVDWPSERDSGMALCSKLLDRPALYELGAAALVRIKRCPTCEARLRARRASNDLPGVVPIMRMKPRSNTRRKGCS